jgi:flagellar biogenesis protein FliO
LPDAPTRPRPKRSVAAAGVVAGQARVRAPRRATVVEANVDHDDTGVNYALRMTEALDAISSAQGPHESRGQPERKLEAEPLRSGTAGFGAPRTVRPVARSGGRFAGWLKGLPPIRLPMGPAIPWRLGLPVLVVLVAVTISFARPAAMADSQVPRLPTPETYAVQQEAPLFTDAQPKPAPAPQPIGIPDSGGIGFDVFDVGIKLIAVLALAYGSLLLLKRTGMGGASKLTLGGKAVPGLQVVSSLTLAPNRTVHVLKVPGGKTVLVGATPNQINLIADLGEIVEDLESETAASFFDVLKGKLSQ